MAMTITYRTKPNPRLTPLELEIMKVLWERGSCTVAELQPELRGKLAYTTVQTMLGVLLRKKKVKRFQVKRAYRYRAVFSREQAVRDALTESIKRMFGGSAEALVTAMVETHQMSIEQLERVTQILAGRAEGASKEWIRIRTSSR